MWIKSRTQLYAGGVAYLAKLIVRRFRIYNLIIHVNSTQTVSQLTNSAKNGTLASSRKPVFLFGRERKLDSEAKRLLEADLEAYPAGHDRSTSRVLRGRTRN